MGSVRPRPIDRWVSLSGCYVETLPPSHQTRSSTSNETLSGGTNISLALKEYFPALTETDVQGFVALYPLSDYDSPSQQFQVATGEPDVICGVRITRFYAHVSHSDSFSHR